MTPEELKKLFREAAFDVKREERHGHKVGELNLLQAFAVCLVDGWTDDISMKQVARNTFSLAGHVEEEFLAKSCEIYEQIAFHPIHIGSKARNFIFVQMKALSEALWRGAKREACIGVAASIIKSWQGNRKRIQKKRMSRKVETDFIVHTRERDERLGWKKVK